MKARWDNERNAISKVQQLRERIEQVNADIARAENEYDLNRAAQLKYGELPGCQKELQKEEALAANRENSLLRDHVSSEEIAKIVARWTGIPVSKLMESERKKLLRLDSQLHKRIVGQDDAVQRVCDANFKIPCRNTEPQSSDRFVPVPRPHRCRQNGAVQSACRGTV